jgi:hypothetical protein
MHRLSETVVSFPREQTNSGENHTGLPSGAYLTGFRRNNRESFPAPRIIPAWIESIT